MSYLTGQIGAGTRSFNPTTRPDGSTGQYSQPAESGGFQQIAAIGGGTAINAALPGVLPAVTAIGNTGAALSPGAMPPIVTSGGSAVHPILQPLVGVPSQANELHPSATQQAVAQGQAITLAVEEHIPPQVALASVATPGIAPTVTPTAPVQVPRSQAGKAFTSALAGAAGGFFVGGPIGAAVGAVGGFILGSF